MRRIDAHAHVIPAAWVDNLPVPGGNISKRPIATAEQLHEMMDRYGIGAAVISTGPPSPFFGDQGQANELARLANEEIAAVVRGEPETFAGLAMLPLPDVGAALRELAYALDELELDGVILLTSVAGTYLGDPSWEPLYAELNRRGMYAFVHPTVPPGGVTLSHPAWLYEFPFETTRAMANLIYAGTFEQYPDIRMQFAHLGGATPFLAHRIASLAEREPEKATAAPSGALSYLGRQYYDTGLSNSAVAVRATAEVAGVDHVLFGTDWPYAALPDGEDPAPGLGFLGPGDRAAVDAGNAAALIPRFRAAWAD